MAIMDEHFKANYTDAMMRPEAIIKGANYRITVLTERLVRLEYGETGEFIDAPTERVVFRNFPLPEFKVEEDTKYLVITTKYFKLQYAKGKPFLGTKIAPDANLRIALVGTDKEWYFGHPEARNFYGTSLDIGDKKVKLQKGLYSTDGFASIDDTTSFMIEEDGFLTPQTKEHIDTYVFMYRRDFGLCLKDYFMLTGRPPLIPRYALGIWWNRNIRYSFNDLKELVLNFNRHKIPLSVLLLGENWHLKDVNNLSAYKTGYTFDKTLFPDPALFVTYMHDRGIRIGLNMNPVEGIYSHEARYASVAQDLGVTNNATIAFNAFNKDVLMAYFHHLVNPLTNIGIDFYWINYDYDTYTLRALNYYHFNDYKKFKTQRGLILSRNSLVAPHKYPVHYSGETTVSWDTLKMLPYFNSTSSNIGVSWWSHDIGGYKDGIEDAELYIRYVELGTFSPIFRFSAKEGHYYKREPWRWDIKTLGIVREYCTLRHRLIPYLYTEGYHYSKTGLPIIQPLYYLYPEIYDEPEYKNEYYFGRQLFVAPITTKKDTVMNRTVMRLFLPEGIWYDFKSGKKFVGNKRYVVFYKDEDYPVFAKSGSIIPLAELEENINVTTSPKKMEIHIFPGQNNTYNLYEDDGYSSLYEENYYIVTKMDYNYLTNNYTLIILPVEGKSGIIPDYRDYKIRFRNTREADDVIVYVGQDKIEADSYVDDTDFVVSLEHVPTTKQITINCKGKDIEIDAVRLVNEDVDSIISDLQIETRLKEKIAAIFFNEALTIQKKRIAIRKLKKEGLNPIFIRMFIKLLEYLAEI